MRNNDDDIGVVGWLKNSFIDFPGTVSTVLFFRGCNLRCPYCHNPQIVSDTLPPIASSVIRDFLEKRAGYIEGVVLSGGEPTLHKNLPEIVDTIKSFGMGVKIDSNGLKPDIIRDCSPDYLALDVKTLPSRYNELQTKEANPEQHLLQSLGLVKSMGENAEVRITVAPTLIDECVVRELGRLLEGVASVFLQPLRTSSPMLDQSYVKYPRIPEETLEQYRSILSHHVQCCTIRGL